MLSQFGKIEKLIKSDDIKVKKSRNSEQQKKNIIQTNKSADKKKRFEFKAQQQSQESSLNSSKSHESKKISQQIVSKIDNEIQFERLHSIIFSEKIMNKQIQHKQKQKKGSQTINQLNENKIQEIKEESNSDMNSSVQIGGQKSQSCSRVFQIREFSVGRRNSKTLTSCLKKKEQKILKMETSQNSAEKFNNEPYSNNKWINEQFKILNSQKIISQISIQQENSSIIQKSQIEGKKVSIQKNMLDQVQEMSKSSQKLIILTKQELEMLKRYKQSILSNHNSQSSIESNHFNLVFSPQSKKSSIKNIPQTINFKQKNDFQQQNSLTSESSSFCKEKQHINVLDIQINEYIEEYEDLSDGILSKDTFFKASNLDHDNSKCKEQKNNTLFSKMNNLEQNIIKFPVRNKSQQQLINDDLLFTVRNNVTNQTQLKSELNQQKESSCGAGNLHKSVLKTIQLQGINEIHPQSDSDLDINFDNESQQNGILSDEQSNFLSNQQKYSQQIKELLKQINPNNELQKQILKIEQILEQKDLEVRQMCNRNKNLQDKNEILNQKLLINLEITNCQNKHISELEQLAQQAPQINQKEIVFQNQNCTINTQQTQKIYIINKDPNDKSILKAISQQNIQDQSRIQIQNIKNEYSNRSFAKKEDIKCQSQQQYNLKENQFIESSQKTNLHMNQNQPQNEFQSLKILTDRLDSNKQLQELENEYNNHQLMKQKLFNNFSQKVLDEKSNTFTCNQTSFHNTQKRSIEIQSERMITQKKPQENLQSCSLVIENLEMNQSSTQSQQSKIKNINSQSIIN